MANIKSNALTVSTTAQAVGSEETFRVTITAGVANVGSVFVGDSSRQDTTLRKADSVDVAGKAKDIYVRGQNETDTVELMLHQI